MPYTKARACAEIANLVANFRANEPGLADAPEAQIEDNYIRKLFRYLNWNTDNTGLSVAEWEFVLQRTDEKGKRPDYILQLDGRQLLVMDAKKVKYDMHDPRWMTQVYAYAYSTQNQPTPRKIDFALLTDFQEFILLDCTLYAADPKAVSNFRILDWTCDDYVSQFDTLWELFERENVRQAMRGTGDSRIAPMGLWSRYLSPKKVKANRIPPDKSFLAKMDDEKTGWRVRLAKDMKKRNPDADGALITAAVQLLIDRLIFVKALSDREIEADYLTQLAEQVEQSGLAADDAGWFNTCRDIFAKLNQFYNGSIFEPRPELEAVTVSNKVVRDVIRDLQPENSPYNFAVLPVEILGTIYERFLGRVVRATEKQVKIEDKPEVRKAGGVYYTPQYIVDYIVQNTVGALLAQCKTPADVAKLRILDPACGSGSFLLGAYAALIKWHENYYAPVETPRRGVSSGSQAETFHRNVSTKRDRDNFYIDSDGRVRLTAKLKRQTLLNNLFGVDIDAQAVEVTRFSLSLKALEDTRHDELYEEVSLFKQTVLPDLRHNIKCGNSLIGNDYSLLPLERLAVKAFEWEVEFPDVYSIELRDTSGGFDAVIGNPPYIFTREQIAENERRYFSSRYALSWEKHNTYMLFMERMLHLLGKRGKGGFIVPNSWLTIESAKLLREALIPRLEIVADLNYMVFNGVSMEPCIFVMSGSNHDSTVLGLRVSSKDKFLVTPTHPINREQWSGPNRRIVFSESTSIAAVVDKIVRVSHPVEVIFDVRTGLQAYEQGKGQPPQLARDVRDHVFDRTRREDKNSVRYLQGRDADRYLLNWSGMWMQYGPWLAQPREFEIFSRPRILVREITSEFPHCLHATFAAEDFLNNKSVLNVLHAHNDETELKRLLGILNSQVISFFYKQRAVKSARKIFPKIVIKNLREFPYPKMIDRISGDRLVALVEQMLAVHKYWASAKTKAEQEQIQRQIVATDRQIDTLVYELYGLTPDEIAVVQGAR